MTSSGTWTTAFAERLSGVEPPAPPWGQRVVGPAPDLRRRIRPEPGAGDEVAVVLGAGGSFGPDIVRALQYQGAGLVVGADLTLTYRVPGAVYRQVDLADPTALRALFTDVWTLAAELDVRAEVVMDLATIQTTPTHDVDRGSLEVGKRALVETLEQAPGEVRLFHMSTAEVYGAPPGAPYREDHAKEPFNDYGREKLREEVAVLAGHGRPTRGGTLRVVALRSWTICMVETDESGRVVEARNYNDPINTVAERLARAGVRTPVVDPTLRGQYHLGEEVAEVAVLLVSEPADSTVWGRALNVTGRAAGHGEIRDVLFEVFTEGDRLTVKPWWSGPVGLVLRSGRLPRRVLTGLGWLLEHSGGALGARDMGARLPFLYRSTDIDATALQEALGHRLSEPEGGSTLEAVRRLATGMRDGGPDAVNQRRYDIY
ncbi:MAG: sugar nucleotide-binding protein [Actinomycetia bacterium]|nr:sugar nucleotide-binding protein [Actinomycetes bacterium]